MYSKVRTIGSLPRRDGGDRDKLKVCAKEDHHKGFIKRATKVLKGEEGRRKKVSCLPLPILLQVMIEG